MDRSRTRPSPTTGALVALLTADVAFAFQQTAIVPAVHTVREDLGGSAEWSAWLVTSYLMVATVATPAMGRLADLHGRRRLVTIGLVIFFVASAAGAFAPNLPMLLACRAVQGVGGAVYPLTLALARREAPAGRSTQAISWSAASFAGGTLLGFAAGGVLTEYASWRWVFGGGAVLIAAATVLLLRLVPATSERAAGGYDMRGTVTLSLASVTLLLALTLIVSLGWTAPIVWILLAASVASAAAWVRVELATTDPLIDIHALGSAPVVRANVSTVGLGWALFSTFLLVPEFARADPSSAGYGLAAGPALVGLALVPVAAGQTTAVAVAAWLAGRVKARAISASGLALLAAATASLSGIHHPPWLYLALFALGLGAGTSLQTSSALATEDVSADVAAASSSLNSTIRRLAGGAGGQLATILFAVFTLASGTTSFSAFTVAYLVSTGLCLIGLVVVLVPLPTRDGGGG